MENLAEQTIQKLTAKKYTLATAESCTGGGISYALTNVAGSSEVFDRTFVTYSNQAKIDMLNVEKNLIETYGAVSQEVAIAMAQGALNNSGVDITVSVTGIAGPGGGSESKPVGLVHFAVATKNNTIHEKYLFKGNRDEVRKKAIKTALTMLIKSLT